MYKIIPSVKSLSLLSLVILILTNCTNNKYNTIEPAEIDIKIVRFENELFNMDIYEIPNESKLLLEKYPDFMRLYTNKIIEIGDPSQDWFNEALLRFITDQAMYEIYIKTSEVFPNLNNQLPKINEGFGRFKALFPAIKVPEIYTYISGFNQSFVSTEDILGISLEKYLGADESLYNNVYPPIPQYQKQNMRPDKIPIDLLKAWIETEFEYNSEQDNLLSKMLYEGKNMYLLKHLLPDVPDTLLWGMQMKKLQFCSESEKHMWTYLIEFKLLFTSDNFRINQFIEEAPFTKDFGKDSPGKAVVWMGYKIIESFMKNNNLTIPDLMKETNYQKILNDSRYSP